MQALAASAAPSARRSTRSTPASPLPDLHGIILNAPGNPIPLQEGLKDQQLYAGVILELTGPEGAVNAYLTCLMLGRNWIVFKLSKALTLRLAGRSIDR